MDAGKIEVKERVSASRKLGRDDATSLAAAAKKVVIAKGASLMVAAPGGKPSAELIQAMLGATGNLRAPTVRVGDTLLVGFNEAEYRSALG